MGLISVEKMSGSVPESATPRREPRKQMFNTGSHRLSNDDIADCLYAECEPIGIAGYTYCCKFHCTDTYADEDEWQKTSRNKGIYFFRFSLGGMNYFDSAPGVMAHYEDYDYLIREWEGEKEFVRRWCSAIGLGEDDYTVEQPQQGNAVWVKFNRPYSLDHEPMSENLMAEAGVEI